VGTFLVPRLVEAGHEVVSVSRGRREPYHDHPAWLSVEQVTLDREVEEAAGIFGERVLALEPDAVIDMICFTPESAGQLVEALRGRVRHFLHCGTIWVHGHSTQVPTPEDLPRFPFGEYGVQKAGIEAYLLDEAHRGGFPATMLHPGHIVGPGWAPVNPAGNFDVGVFERLAKGGELALPNLGLTLRGYAEAVSGWFGKKADLRFVPWEQWREEASDEEAAGTWDHIAHSPNCSIAKATKLLGYRPRYTSLEAVREALGWLIEDGRVEAEWPGAVPR
jgi:nucleoside-diphosphate-sugar epimerase